MPAEYLHYKRPELINICLAVVYIPTRHNGKDIFDQNFRLITN